MKVIVQLRTGTGQNDREHWRAQARRVKAERAAVAWMLAIHKPPPAGPITVHLCRVSPGAGLDAHDNLRGSLKAPVDQVAEWLGLDDRDPSITWEYSQRRGAKGEWRVEIEVLPGGADRGCDAERLVPSVLESGFLSGSHRRAAVGRDPRVALNDVNEACPVAVDNPRLREERESASMDGGTHRGSVPMVMVAIKGFPR